MLNKNVLVNKSKTTLTQRDLLYTKQVLSVLRSKMCANISTSFFLDVAVLQRCSQLSYLTKVAQAQVLAAEKGKRHARHLLTSQSI